MRPRTVPGIMHYARTHREVFGFKPDRLELSNVAFDEAVSYLRRTNRPAYVLLASDGSRAVEINGIFVVTKAILPVELQTERNQE